MGSSSERFDADRLNRLPGPAVAPSTTMSFGDIGLGTG